MQSKLKKILLPLIILVTAIAVFVAMASMKKPAEKKEMEFKPTLVAVETLEAKDWQFKIQAQGMVRPVKETDLTVEVSAKVLAISDTFFEGSFVKQGDVLVKLEQSDYLTELKLSKANLAKALAALKEEKARVEVAKREWKGRIDTASDLALRIPQLETEQANVEYAQAQVEQAQRNLDRTFIRAPYDGVIVASTTEVGQFLSKGTQVGKIYGSETAEIRLPVNYTELKFIDVGSKLVQPAPSPVILYTNSASKKAENWLAYLSHSEAVIDNTSRMTYLVAKISDPYNLTGLHQQAIQFGQFVNAEISGTKANQVFKINRQYLTSNQEIILFQNNEIKLFKPEILRFEGKFIYIDSGLSNGDQIITSAISNPVNGMKVRLNSTAQKSIKTNELVAN